MFETAIDSIRDAHPIFYFLILLAAGTGVPVNEDALNIWVGGLLGRGEAAYAPVAYIVAVYAGVVMSDMWTFFIGRLAQRAIGERVKKRFFKNPAKVDRALSKVHRYGDRIGFVQRLSVGARVPLSFMSGYVGISSAKFFLGTCLGACVTLPIQLLIGYLMHDQIEKAVEVAGDYGILVAVVVLSLAGLFLYRRLTATDDQDATT